MKAKKIIIAIVAILVVLGGVFAGLWFFTDVFNFLKPANEVAVDQFEKALNLDGVKFADYSKVLQKYKDVSDKPFKSKFNVSANLNISELDSKSKDLVNNSKITIESNSDITNKKAQNKIGLYSKDSEVLTLDMVTDNDKVGLGCKDLYDKYLTVSMEDLINYIKDNSKNINISNSDVEALELMMENMSNPKLNTYDLLYISNDDLKHFDETYRDCLKKLISKDCYTSEKNVEVDVDGNSVKTTAYYLTLTGEDSYKFIKDLTNLLKDDSVLTRIITDKANLILESAGQKKIDEEDVKEALANITDKFLGEFESLKDEKDSAIQFAIYSKNNKPVRIDFNTIKDINKKDDKETILSIEYAENKNIYSIYQDEKAVFTITDEYSKKTDEEKIGKLKLSASGMSIGTLDYEIVNKKDESKLNLSLNIPLASLYVEIKLSENGDYSKEPVEVTGSMKFGYQKESAEIKFDGTVEFGDVSIPELTSSNSVNVMKLSEKELQSEVEKILKKASEVLPSRLKLLGLNVKSSDIYQETPKVEINEDNTSTNDDSTETSTTDNDNSDKEV